MENGTSETDQVQARDSKPTETSPLIDSQPNGDTNHATATTTTTTTTTAPGVARIESFSSTLTPADRICVFIGILIIGWSYGLDGLVRSTYQSYAASSLGVHTLVSTINVLQSVVSAAAYTPAAKLADIVGRFELVVVSVVFYIAGTVIESTAGSIHAFIAGAVLYQIGYTCVVLLVEVIIADISSMRSRVFFSYLPAVPFLVNTWVSGNLASAVLRVADWRVGIGMWAFIYAVAATPLLVSLHRARRHVKTGEGEEEGEVENGRPFESIQLSTFCQKGMEIYNQLDVGGISLMAAILTLILTPLTIAEEEASRWRNPIITVPIILGTLCIPIFIHWELHLARNPLIPGHLLKDRGVGTALAVRCLLNFAWAIQGNYIYTVLIVAFDFSITAATRIATFFTLFGVLSGLLIGLLIYRIRRLKYFIVAGTLLFLAAFALLSTYTCGSSPHARLGVSSAQLLLGIAAGFCAYPTQASIQAAANHHHVSTITGLYLTTFNIGNALGMCASGVIWSKHLLPILEENLSSLPDLGDRVPGGAHSLARDIYRSPFELVPRFPVGSGVREMVIVSYGRVEWLLCVAGLGLCVPMVGFALGLRNPKLARGQSQPEVEGVDLL